MSQNSQAYILGQFITNIPLENWEQSSSIALCSQNEIIIEKLTVQQNLEFIARIKGLSKEECTNNTTMLLQMLEMTPFKDTIATKLSHNNKRKLSFGMSVII